MSDPAGKEEHRNGSGEVGGREQHRARVKEISYMVQSHEDHDRSAEHINTLEARGALQASSRILVRFHSEAKKARTQDIPITRHRAVPKKEARTEARASFAAPTAALIANRDSGFARAG